MLNLPKNFKCCRLLIFYHTHWKDVGIQHCNLQNGHIDYFEYLKKLFETNEGLN